MKSTSTAPFQSPSGDFDPALLLLNLRNKDDGDSSDELRRASSQASSGPVSHAATEHDDLAGTSFTRESSFASSDTCTCKKSRCLKKYCQCFASNAVCNQHCRCIECENTSFDNPPRKRAIEELLIRNPTAFVPKIKVDTAITVDEDVIQQTSHRVGCRCRKSMCLKKYCECYQGGVLCTTICTCLDCRNKGDGSGLDDAMLTNDGQMDMEVSLVKAKIIKKQTSFTKKRPLSFLEEESPVCANYDTAKFFPEDGAMPAFAAALHSAANGPLSMATGSGAVGNPTSLLSANLMKHALSSSSSSGPTASSSTLTRHNTFPVRPSQLTAADHHHEQDMKRMKSLSAFEAAASSSASHMQHSTPIANKTPLTSSSSSSSQSRTTRATSNSLETPRNNPNISPQSWSIAQAFYRLGDEFAAKQQRNGSLLLTDEQRKAIRLSMSSSISTEGREAIAESVLRTLRFSAENFFQQFSETTPEAAQAEKVAIADNNSNNSSSSSSNDPTTTRRASAYTATAGSSSTRSMLMDVDEIDDTPAAAAKAAPVAPSTQKKQKVDHHHHHHNSLTEEDEEGEEENTTEIVAQRARALSEASAKENTDPSSVTQTASAMREIQVTDYKASPFAGKHPHHQSKRLVHRKGSRTTTATTHEQHQNKRRRRNSTGSRHSAHDDSETEAEDDDNLSDDGERLRRRADSMNDDDDKNDDDNDDDASTEDERDNDFDGEGEDRERRYLKKMAAKQRAVQAALDAAAMTMPPVAVSE